MTESTNMPTGEPRFADSPYGGKPYEAILESTPMQGNFSVNGSLNFMQAVDKNGQPISAITNGDSSFVPFSTLSFPNQISPLFKETFRHKTKYVYTQDGSIDWRAMAPKNHLCPNKELFKKRGVPVPESIEGLADSELLIKLAGIKELARLRGFRRVKFDPVYVRPDYISMKCTITWLPNEENPYEVEYDEVANASVENVGTAVDKFLETIAANRAFVRCVRSFLNIHVVGDDELYNAKLDAVPTEEVAAIPSPHSTLSGIAKKKGYNDFEAFKTFLNEAKVSELYQHKKMDLWKDWTDLPAKETRTLVGLLSEIPDKV